MNKTNFEISLNPSKILNILALIIIMLIIASLIGQIFQYFFDHEYVFGFVPKFNLDKEANVPTYFSSFLLLFAGVLFGIIAIFKLKTDDMYAKHWSVLAILFTVASIDESAGIHELTILPLRHFLGTSGFLYYAWVIPGMLFVIFLSIAFWKFGLDIPKTTKRLLIIGVIVYFTGALGLELIGGYYTELYGRDNFFYSIITTIEESLELIGVVLIIKALLNYIEVNLPKVTLTFGSDDYQGD